MSDRLGCPPALAQARIGSRGEASTARKRRATSPGAVSFFGTVPCQVQAITGVVPARARKRSGRGSLGWVAPGSSPARVGGSGRQRTVAARCGTELLSVGCASSEVRRRQPRCARSDAVALCEGPRRGTKPMEGQGVSRLATVAERPDSTAEQRLEVDVVVSWSSWSVPATVRCSEPSAGHRQRQGGNGHGDVVRLLARIPSGGVKSAAGTVSVLPPRSGSPGRVVESGSPKRSEPHDRQRDATSPRPPSGGNRRGGAKPRGRNGIPRLAPRD